MIAPSAITFPDGSRRKCVGQVRINVAILLAHCLENAFISDRLALQDGASPLKYPFTGRRLEDPVVSIQPDASDMKRTES